MSSESGDGLELDTMSAETVFALGCVLQGNGVHPGEVVGALCRPPWGKGRSKPEEERNEAFVRSLIKEKWIEVRDDDGPPQLIPSERLEEVAEPLQARCDALVPNWRQQLIDHIAERLEIPGDSPLSTALEELDRGDFVPDPRRLFAVSDIPILIDGETGMTESALHAVVMTLQAVSPERGEKILVCGAKGGYLAALAAHIVGPKGRVCALDWQQNIVEHALRGIERCTLPSRVEVILERDVTQGFEDRAPWDIIVVNGAIPNVPHDLIAQLDDKRGRLLFYLADGRSSRCYIVRKNDEIVQNEALSKFRYTGVPGRFGYGTMRELQQQYDQAKALAETATTDLKALQTGVPYPVSKAFMSAFNAREDTDRHHRTIKAYEVLIKMLAIPCIAAVDQDGAADEEFARHIAPIGAKPSLGHWLAIMGHAAELAHKHQLGRVVRDDINRKLKSRTVRDAWKMLGRYLKKPNAEKRNGAVKLSDFLQDVVEYRNASEAHGPVASAAVRGEHADLLLSAYHAVVTELALFRRFDLIHVESVENRRGGRMKVTVQRLESVVPSVERRNESRRELEPGIYFAEGCTPLLSLDPWIIWGHGKLNEPELFIYNTASAGNTYQYLAYHNTDEYPGNEERDAMRSFLGRHKQAAAVVDRGAAETMFRAMLDVCAADGVISSQELTQLRTLLPSLGLVDSEDQVVDYVAAALAVSHPGAHIDA